MTYIRMVYTTRWVVLAHTNWRRRNGRTLLKPMFLKVATTHTDCQLWPGSGEEWT